MLALSFIFLNFAIGALLNACDRQKYNTWVMAATATLSVIINFLLIPRLGALGATITVAITSAFAFFAGLAAIPAITAYDYRKVVSNSAKIIIAALLMGLAAYWLKAYLNIFLVVPSAGLAYFYLLLRFGVLRLQDIMSIAASFRKKKIDLN
jgi:O-antigen/teichoic acid export membrane protein